MRTDAQVPRFVVCLPSESCAASKICPKVLWLSIRLVLGFSEPKRVLIAFRDPSILDQQPSLTARQGGHQTTIYVTLVSFLRTYTSLDSEMSSRRRRQVSHPSASLTTIARLTHGPANGGT